MNSLCLVGIGFENLNRLTIVSISFFDDKTVVPMV